MANHTSTELLQPQNPAFGGTVTVSGKLVVAAMGTVTLSGSGTAVVYTTGYTSTAQVFISPQAVMGTQGNLKITTTVTNVEFTIASSQSADRSIVAWVILYTG